MSKLPKYKQVFHHLKQQIKDGEYEDGDKLPLESELARRFDTSAITVKHALTLLCGERLVRRVPGNGTFVTLDKKEALLPAGAGAFNVGVAMSGASDAFGTQFICAACAEAREHGCGVLMGIGYSTQQEEAAIINLLVNRGAKGIIIMPVHAQVYNIELFKHAIDGFPFVLADRYLEGMATPYVVSDNEQAACDAARYLLSIGHQQIAYFSPTISSTSLIARRNGYIRAYAENNLSLNPSLILSDIHGTMPEFRSKGETEDMEHIRAFVLRHPEVSAIIAADSPTAILTEETLTKMGLRVPDDISIVCFDAFDSPVKTSHFTHVKQNEEQMGKLAFARLYAQIIGKSVPLSTVLKTELVLGRSSRPFGGQ